MAVVLVSVFCDVKRHHDHRTAFNYGFRGLVHCDYSGNAGNTGWHAGRAGAISSTS